MTYYESAEDITISRKRAVIEIERHGLIDDLDQFDADMGGARDQYDAQEVLSWLGY